MIRTNKLLSKSAAQSCLLLMTVTCLTVLWLLFLYQYDNKYTAKADIAQAGTVSVSDDGVRFLVDGFTIYPDVLLTPEDLEAGTTAEVYPTWIGQYADLSAFHEDRAPYGTATYRIVLKGNGTKSLFIQEPFSSCRIYANGKLIGSAGDVSPDTYRPLIQDKICSFEMDGETELIFQVSNYSHYYGGLYYPPAIGDTDSISHLVILRIIFYSFLCFTSLTLALFCIALWLRKRKKPDFPVFYLGLLSFSFALWVAYPFFRFAGLPSVRLLYALQDVSSLTGVYCTVRISLLLFAPVFEKLNHVISAVCLGMCGVGAVIPLFVLPAFPDFTAVYGPLLSWYKLAAAAFLIVLSFYGSLARCPYARFTLAAMNVYGVCLLANILCINTFEPMRTGWQDEYGAFFVVILFAVTMQRRSREMLAQNQRLTEHLKEEVESQTRHLNKLLAERGQLLAELGHDMKSPLTSLSNMAQILGKNELPSDDGGEERIRAIEAQCDRLSERLGTLQEYAAAASVPSVMKMLSLQTLLTDFYRDNKPIVELDGPDLLLCLTALPCLILGDAEKLGRMLENLVYNAKDFTPPDGQITITLECEQKFAYIRVCDTGCGIPHEQLSDIFKHSYTTRPEDGGQGLGLAIAQDIALEHNGHISVSSSLSHGTTFIVRLPLCSD